MDAHNAHGASLPISDPSSFPWAIVAKRPGVDGAELHAGIVPGTRDAWKARTDELRASGEYEWVRWVAMGFMDEESGEFLDHRSRPPV